MDKRPLVVVGFSGNAIDALSTIEASHRILAFLDDNPDLHNRTFEGIPILPTAALAEFPGAQVICLIGSEHSFRKREGIIQRLGLPPSRFATAIHPAANVSRLARIGRGCVVFPGVQVVSNAVIGDHVVILPQSVIHHDSAIGDLTLIGSGVVVAGRVRVGRSCYLGSGCTIKNNVDIGDGALVGMAANIIRDVPPGSTMIGNPGRLLRQN